MSVFHTVKAQKLTSHKMNLDTRVNKSTDWIKYKS